MMIIMRESANEMKLKIEERQRWLEMEIIIKSIFQLSSHQIERVF